MASFPGAAVSFPARSDGSTIFAQHINALQDEVTAIETELLAGHFTGAGAPTGGIMAFGGSTPPQGFLLCDGTAVSRTTYAALFAILGIAFGAGDGSNTFNLPNLQQRFPMGKAASGTGAALGASGGAIDHTHTFTGGTLNAGLAAATGTTATGQTGSGFTAPTAAHTHTVTGTVTGTVGTNNPPFQVVNYIVKT